MIISSILCSRRFSLVKSHGCFLLEKRPSSAIYLTFLRTPPLPSQLKIWKHFLKISNNWVIKKEMLHIWIINLSINNTIFFFIVLALGSVIPHTSVIKWFSFFWSKILTHVSTTYLTNSNRRRNARINVVYPQLSCLCLS